MGVRRGGGYQVKMASLRKTVCLVTGGASGLGRATVQRLTRNGARVVIADLPSSDGDSVAKELGGNTCCFAPTDVSMTCICSRMQSLVNNFLVYQRSFILLL